MMVPVGRLVVLRTTEKHNLIDAITLITWPGLIAPVVGPPVGGFITTYASWQLDLFSECAAWNHRDGAFVAARSKLEGRQCRPFDIGLDSY